MQHVRLEPGQEVLASRPEEEQLEEHQPRPGQEVLEVQGGEEQPQSWQNVHLLRHEEVPRPNVSMHWQEKPQQEVNPQHSSRQ